MSELEKQMFCAGCRDDFYNHRDDGQKCWSLAKAQIVTRFRIGWWTPMDRRENFAEVETLDCHHAPGKYAQLKQLPEHLR